MMIRIVTVTLQAPSVVAEHCKVADSFFSRFKGLMGQKNLPSGQGLLLTRCRDIHMWWMQIPLDVVFLKKEAPTNHEKNVTPQPEFYQVTSVFESIKPWRLLPIRDGRADHTLELPINTIRRCDLKAGTRLAVTKI